MILRDLIILNKRHFRDFLKSKEKIASNILADRLEQFVLVGLVRKEKDTKNKSAAIYTPTAKALELLPTIFAMMHWGLKYNPNTDMSIPVMRELKTSEKRLKNRLISQFE